MAKLSTIFPSRDEKFLIPTIHDYFRNVRGESEAIVVIDSDKWPEGWKQVTDQYPNLHTIFHGKPLGMRRAINDGVGSAISRGAKFVAKFDAHCSFSEGFDEILTSECDKDWIVVPRRGRLDADNWCATDTHKPDIDYHYLSFPSDPNDFGGPGLNGKVWEERARERANILVDDEMSSQGSGWLMHAEFFTRMGFMDESRYGPFWNEFQELGMCAWLSGGQVKINKKCKYLHLHKGRTHGRGYRLDESWLRQGRDHTMKWIFNEAWDERQVRPFSWLIEHFWPVPSWPDNWEEMLYATRKPRILGVGVDGDNSVSGSREPASTSLLTIRQAWYGFGEYGIKNTSGEWWRSCGSCYRQFNSEQEMFSHNCHNHNDPPNWINVTERVRELVVSNSLDIVVSNSVLQVGNPFRGKKKLLRVVYDFDGGEILTRTVSEKDWLIIGQARQLQNQGIPVFDADTPPDVERMKHDVIAFTEHVGIDNLKPTALQLAVIDEISKPMTAPALNDYLIRKFSISPQRLRGPMPIELRDFHRNDLAQLFAELGFRRGAEIGVAEGKFSEILCKANPDLNLLCVDPWHSYKDNPQSKTKEKDEFAYRETQRRLTPYPNVTLDMRLSMDAVRSVLDGSLDFVSIDGHHGFRFVMMDLLCWSIKVRKGGIILLDDYMYLDRKRWGAGVVEAVQAFTLANEINPWFICDADRSVDAFFVKGDWK